MFATRNVNGVSVFRHAPILPKLAAQDTLKDKYVDEPQAPMTDDDWPTEYVIPEWLGWRPDAPHVPYTEN